MSIRDACAMACAMSIIPPGVQGTEFIEGYYSCAYADV